MKAPTPINKPKVEKEEKSYDLKVERLLNNQFAEALKKLATIPMRPNFAMKAKRITLLMYNAAKEYIPARTACFEKYCDKDKDGELLFEDVQKSRYKIPDDKIKACEEELNTLVAKTIKVPVIYASAFVGVDVTPEFLTLLDGIVVED